MPCRDGHSINLSHVPVPNIRTQEGQENGERNTVCQFSGQKRVRQNIEQKRFPAATEDSDAWDREPRSELFNTNHCLEKCLNEYFSDPK